MLNTEAIQYIKSTLAAFGPCNEASGIQLRQETWAKLHEAMSVLIEQPAQQEPVAYIRVSKTGNVMACAKTGDFYKLPDKTLLYTSPPPQRKPLTDEQICRIKAQIKGTLDVQFVVFARAIEAAHNITGEKK
jgi:hypothetical protein